MVRLIMQRHQFKTDSYFHKFKGDIMRLFDTNTPWKEPSINVEVSEMYPVSTIVEEKETISLKIVLPGIIKDELKVNLDHDIVKIEVDSSFNTNSSYQTDKDQRKFTSIFNLPSLVVPEQSKVTFSNGLLAIEMQKSGNKSIN
jgi:HSP20 family molecular chaperone IbpA